ncbi:hypothetical protein QYM36_019488 [Artemia franciscana]|uniref:PiggyBac transposable element-derived protein domain-containing protein n=1 Tax=Artemia franciscana TaxID=6661 RepID=A0AA88H153_ARTSF|nr:hypothetical protein QYM36_019488 [Artemia franciscana]
MQKEGVQLKVTSKEMGQFMRIHMLMGIIKQPTIPQHWDRATRFPLIADVMSRDDGLRANQKKIPAEERQRNHEQMVPYKERLSFKHHLKDKPYSWGIKIFSHAGVSRIIYIFVVYTEKGSVPVNEHGRGAEVGLRLAEAFPRNENFMLFFDNYYTSIPLIRELLLLGIYSAGTVRVNRLKGCSIEADDVLKKTEEEALNTELRPIAVEWLRSGLKTRAKLRKNVVVVRSLCIAEYNKFMGGVDLSDMLMELFLDLSAFNAWLLYRRHMGQHGRTHQKSFLDFKSKIAYYLTSANDGTPRSRGRPLRDLDCSTPKRPKLVKPKPYDKFRCDGIQHWPEAVADKKRCRLCSTYDCTFNGDIFLRQGH